MQWSRQRIIREIVRREGEGLSLVTSGEQSLDFRLYQAASRLFGSWRNALQLAGISPERARLNQKWQPSKVLAMIRALSRRRRPLRPLELRERYSGLTQAAQRFYGSWPKAVLAAGVDLEKMRCSIPWTAERVTEAILLRALKSEPMAQHAVRPRSLARAGAEIFGDWGAALAAAGLDPEKYESIRARKTPDGGDAASSVTTANNLITTTSSERQSAHRSPRRGRYPSEEVLCEAIRARLKARLPMNAAAVEKEDRALYRATRSRFGSWHNALGAAGLNPGDFRKRRWIVTARTG